MRHQSLSMKDREGKYLWSLYEEHYNTSDYYDTEVEAIADATAYMKNHDNCKGVYIGKARHHTGDYFFTAESIVERAQDEALNSDYSECTEDYLCVSDDAKRELQAFLDKWIAKHEEGFISIEQTRYIPREQKGTQTEA